MWWIGWDLNLWFLFCEGGVYIRLSYWFIFGISEFFFVLKSFGYEI